MNCSGHHYTTRLMTPYNKRDVIKLRCQCLLDLVTMNDQNIVGLHPLLAPLFSQSTAMEKNFRAAPAQSRMPFLPDPLSQDYRRQLSTTFLNCLLALHSVYNNTILRGLSFTTLSDVSYALTTRSSYRFRSSLIWDPATNREERM